MGKLFFGAEFKLRRMKLDGPESRRFLKMRNQALLRFESEPNSKFWVCPMPEFRTRVNMSHIILYDPVN